MKQVQKDFTVQTIIDGEVVSYTYWILHLTNGTYYWYKIITKEYPDDLKKVTGELSNGTAQGVVSKHKASSAEAFTCVEGTRYHYLVELNDDFFNSQSLIAEDFACASGFYSVIMALRGGEEYPGIQLLNTEPCDPELYGLAVLPAEPEYHLRSKNGKLCMFRVTPEADLKDIDVLCGKITNFDLIDGALHTHISHPHIELVSVMPNE